MDNRIQWAQKNNEYFVARIYYTGVASYKWEVDINPWAYGKEYDSVITDRFDKYSDADAFASSYTEPEDYITELDDVFVTSYIMDGL